MDVLLITGFLGAGKTTLIRHLLKSEFNAKEKVAVDMISAGASKVAYYFIIPRRDLKKTVHAIHEEYFS